MLPNATTENFTIAELHDATIECLEELVPNACEIDIIRIGERAVEAAFNVGEVEHTRVLTLRVLSKYL